MKIKTRSFLLGLSFFAFDRTLAQDSTRPEPIGVSDTSTVEAPVLVKKKRAVNLKKIQYGVASYYAKKFQGRRTASGEKYDSTKLTAAHNGLPFGTWIRVTNQRNGRSVVVKVNDRLHHANKRVVDLSEAAARKLGFYSRGLTKVKVEVLGKTNPSIPELGINNK